MKVRYITEVIDRHHKGWVEIRTDESNKLTLPYSTRVELLGKTRNGEIIKVLDGSASGVVANLPFDIDSTSGTISVASSNKISYSNQVAVIISSTNKLRLDGKEYDILLGKGFEKGSYLVKFPIKRRVKNMEYIDESRAGSRFAETWFPLIRKNDFNLSRYIHFGSYSLGCVTVRYYPNKRSNWQNVFFALMRSRLNKEYLAKLIVK